MRNGVFPAVPVDQMPTDILLNVLPAHSRLREALQPTNSGNVIHTADDVGPVTYLGSDGIDTLVVDYLLPLNSPSPFETQAFIALDAVLAGLPHDIRGSQLDGSTITNVENLTVNVGSGYSRLWFYGDDAANVITLNVAAGSSGSKTVLAHGGDDTIISNNLSSFVTDLDGMQGNDRIIATGAANIHDSGLVAGASGDDEFVLGSGAQFINFYGAHIGNNSVTHFTAGEDLLLFFGFGSPYAPTVTEQGRTTTFTVYDSSGNVAGSVTVDATNLVNGVDYFI